jgi:SAM-dependent methyltransferase
MKKTLVFGAGKNFLFNRKHIYENYNVCGFLDNDVNKQSQMIDGFKVYAPADVGCIEYDEILITPAYKKAILEQLKQLNVPKYKINLELRNSSYINDVNEKLIGLDNKIILDIGCGNGDLVKYIARYHNPHMVIGIDITIDKEERGERWFIDQGNAEELKFADNCFDVIFSVAAFEHIKDIEKALQEVKRVLKPGGSFCCSFGHIWTSICGYHDNEDEEMIMAIPPWGHLYLSEEELNMLFVRAGYYNFIEYVKNNLNHYTRTDLANWIIHSGMLVKEYKEIPLFSRATRMGMCDVPSELTADVVEKISKTKYRIEDLKIGEMQFVLEKM